MYYVLQLQRRVQIEPRLFNRNIEQTIIQKLINDVEGKFAGGNGFVVAVINLVHGVPSGQLDDGTGFAIFPVTYNAIVYRPFKNEVVDAIVSRVTQHGFFAEAGPLTIFVSHHLIPEDMAYQSMPEGFVSTDQGETITRDTKVRLKIIGLKIEVTDISATGSMRDDYLGVNE
uniref:DNA-directed RNA polymerase II subunit RPB7 n=1 Tax=Timspurckia oligopyrenoides TaxID=708627 RepID=A0A7S1ERI9_9RHOD|mmetsp:Transcript_1782/g.3194  ORF Transcript_1782/g.3194 Transcript_1782/m.3194 type:complete len:172 (+) Transcript_1782:103-618(+)|eukprot:CAMPEP_0182443364 /NCGR_PEP_ID=MMETSP1172-20130603/2121_1 /TAXON_ID=708627 /ORGANISM="Timspurckia oligopyrenoides, Strain CCMP3278" /LENGTH=171 /DNA_ID=CAMNT_0024638623 /DNA_START=88 /DNA_END=603 /DNA_ORIENTATION=+